MADPAAQRARITAELVERTGIDETMIEQLVRAFYAKVRADPLLGPIFASRITDWEPHLTRMCAFWSSVTLMSGRYHGQPMVKHMKLPIDAHHFDRWLALFKETAEQICAPMAAEHFSERAGRIAESLELGIAASQGIMLGRNQRFLRPDIADRRPQ